MHGVKEKNHLKGEKNASICWTKWTRLTLYASSIFIFITSLCYYYYYTTTTTIKVAVILYAPDSWTTTNRITNQL